MRSAEIIDRIFIGPKPQKAKDIIELKKNGVTAILSLLEDKEGAKEIESDAVKEEMAWAQVSIPDAYYEGIPTAEQIQKAVDQLDEWLKDSQKHHRIYLHCLVARGRSPLIAIAYLCLKKGERLAAAITKVKNAWPPTDPNAKQIRVLCELLEKQGGK